MKEESRASSIQLTTDAPIHRADAGRQVETIVVFILRGCELLSLFR
jgi:hypothetical protein